MATEKRLICMDDTMDKLRAYADRKHAAGHNDLANGILKAVGYIRNNMVRVDAVEVVHGEWVDRYARRYANPLYECSECRGVALYKAEVDELWHKKFVQVLSDYCPNCGAKMDGDGNAND